MSYFAKSGFRGFSSIMAILLLGALVACGSVQSEEKTMRLLNYEMERLDGSKASLTEYQGKVVLVVNTASKCGFTSQYAGLQKLYDTYKEKGLVILGFPCNQFGSQEPGSEKEIGSFCQQNYGVTFPMFAKIEVNGEKTAPFYQALKEAAPGLLGSKKIKWNFTKFLISRDGQSVQRFAPQTKPESLTGAIEKLL